MTAARVKGMPMRAKSLKLTSYPSLRSIPTPAILQLAPTGVMFQSAATFFYIANEGMSILENAALIGVPVPKRIKKMLEVMREENDDDDGNGEG